MKLFRLDGDFDQPDGLRNSSEVTASLITRSTALIDTDAGKDFIA